MLTMPTHEDKLREKIYDLVYDLVADKRIAGKLYDGLIETLRDNDIPLDRIAK